jgi:hypothetical protein
MSVIKRLAVMFVLVVVLIAALGVSSASAQCAMCRTALTESPEGQQMAAGFNSAILFLLGAPYLVFGTLAGSLWISKRRKGRLVSPPAFASLRRGLAEAVASGELDHGEGG